MYGIYTSAAILSYSSEDIQISAPGTYIMEKWTLPCYIY